MVWASLVAQLVKNLPAMWETWICSLGFIPGLGRSPRGEHGNPLQYSCLENPVDGGPWWAAVYGVTQSWTRLKRLSIARILSGGLVAQSCRTLCDPVDCSPLGSSVRGILQARILKWIAIPSSRGSSRPRDQTHISYVSCIGRQVLYHLYHQECNSKCKVHHEDKDKNPFGKGIIFRAEFIEEDESAQGFEQWWVYAGKRPDDILGERSWVIE